MSDGALDIRFQLEPPGGAVSDEQWETIRLMEGLSAAAAAALPTLFDRITLARFRGDLHAAAAIVPPKNDGPITQAKIDRVFGSSRDDEDQLKIITAKAQRHLHPPATFISDCVRLITAD